MDEAEARFQEGLTLLARVPEFTARSQLELDLRMGLITAQAVTKGPGSSVVEQSLTQAYQLCQLVGDEPTLFRVLWHLWQLHFHRGNMRKAQGIALECLGIARRIQEPASLLLAHEMLGPTLYRLGDMVAAYEHLLEARRLYEAQPMQGTFLFGLDAGLHGRCNEALVLWYLGYLDQAQDRSSEALAIAERNRHPYHLATALSFAAALYQRAGGCGEDGGVRPQDHPIEHGAQVRAVERDRRPLPRLGCRRTGRSECRIWRKRSKVLTPSWPRG